MFHSPLLAKGSALPTSGTLLTEGFEGCSLSTFTLVNTGGANAWRAGTAISKTGSCSAYCSQSISNLNYVNESTGYASHMYVDILIPSNAASITLKFWWQCEGENASSVTAYDYGFVGIGKTTWTPSSSDVFASGDTNRERLGLDSNNGKFNTGRDASSATTWIYEEFEITDTNEFFTAGSNIRLWFGFTADTSVSARRGFCIDDLEVTWEAAAPPAGACGGTNPDGGTTNVTTSLLYGLYDYWWWVGLYLDTDVGNGTAKTITSIEVYFEGFTTPYTFEDVTIKLYHSTDTQWSSVPNVDLSNVNSSNETTVFFGDITVSGAGWLTINLDTGFSYDGSSNIIVEFSQNGAGSGNPSGYGNTHADSAISLRNARKGESFTFPTGAGQRGNDWLVNMRFNC